MAMRSRNILDVCEFGSRIRSNAVGAEERVGRTLSRLSESARPQSCEGKARVARRGEVEGGQNRKGRPQERVEGEGGEKSAQETQTARKVTKETYIFVSTGTPVLDLTISVDAVENVSKAEIRNRRKGKTHFEQYKISAPTFSKQRPQAVSLLENCWGEVISVRQARQRQRTNRFLLSTPSTETTIDRGTRSILSRLQVELLLFVGELRGSADGGLVGDGFTDLEEGERGQMAIRKGCSSPDFDLPLVAVLLCSAAYRPTPVSRCSQY
jgi:hypothetical protein